MKNSPRLFGKIIFAVFTISLLSISIANAHEPRDGVAGGVYNVSVGHRVEPGFAGEPNAFDLFVRNAEDNSNEDVGEIELDVYVIRLRDDDFDAKVVKIKKLTGDLRRDFSQPNRFNIYYLPKRPSAVGFIIKGTIDGNIINEKFVCGGGTQNEDGRSFGCIDRIQRF